MLDMDWRRVNAEVPFSYFASATSMLPSPSLRTLRPESGRSPDVDCDVSLMLFQPGPVSHGAKHVADPFSDRLQYVSTSAPFFNDLLAPFA